MPKRNMTLMVYDFYGIPIQYRIERRNGGEDFVLVLLLRGTYNKTENRYELSAGKHGRVMFELSPRKMMTKKNLSLRERIGELMPIFWEGALNKMGKKPFTKLPCRERRLQLPDLPLAAIYSADMGEMLRRLNSPPTTSCPSAWTRRWRCAVTPATRTAAST